MPELIYEYQLTHIFKYVTKKVNVLLSGQLIDLICFEHMRCLLKTSNDKRHQYTIESH